MKKKTYNPLKLFGSYIGAVAGYLFLWAMPLEYYNFFWSPIATNIGLGTLWIPNVLVYGIHILTGFGIGYLVHAMVRYSRKR